MSAELRENTVPDGSTAPDAAGGSNTADGLSASAGLSGRGAGDRTRRRPPAAEGLARRFAVVAVWALLVVIFSILRPDTFPTTSTFTTLFASQSPLAILALGLLIPLTAGDYDLSVAAVLTLSSVLVGVLNVDHGWSVWAAAGVAIGAGVVVGLVNAVLCVVAKLDSFIITLGTSTFVAGLALWVSNSTPVSGVSGSLVNVVVVDRFLGLSLEFWYVLAIAVILWYVLTFTPQGRRILVVGRGRDVARLSGLRVGRIRTLSFVAAGALSALAGVVYVGTSGAADPSAGTSLLLPAFAAVFLGATTIVPGRFNPWGTLVAVYFLTTGITGLSLLGISTFVQDLFYGGALVIAVLLSSLSGTRTGAIRRLLRRGRRVLPSPVHVAAGTVSSEGAGTAPDTQAASAAGGREP